MKNSNSNPQSRKDSALYRVISYLYLASIFCIFIFAPLYIGIVLATMIFWLSLRGIFFKNLLMGSSTILQYGPIKGESAKILSFVLFFISISCYYWLFTMSGLHFNLLIVGGIFIYLPLVMVLGMYLKGRFQGFLPKLKTK